MQDKNDRRTGELVPIEHIPVMAPRKGVHGEHAYLQLWQRFMERCDEDDIESIFSHVRVRPLDQRQATVAASFVKWLGTNCGNALLRTVEQGVMRGGHSDPDTRYLRAWEGENRRSPSRNGGIRTVEVILSPHLRFEPVDAPVVTVDDLDVIDCICLWLPTQDGQHFIKAADAQVQAAQRAEYLFGDDGEPRVIGGRNRTTSGAIGRP